MTWPIHLITKPMSVHHTWTSLPPAVLNLLVSCGSQHPAERVDFALTVDCAVTCRSNHGGHSGMALLPQYLQMTQAAYQSA